MAAITSTTESWNGHKFSEVESHVKGNYLQLGGGTMTGRLNVNGDGSARGEIYLISSGDVPNDLYFGAGGSSDWSISSRGTSDGKYIGLYNNAGKGWIWKVGYTTGILDFSYRPTYNGTNLALATDLNSYSLTSHTHSNYSLTNHTHSNYSLTSHTHSYLPLAGGTMSGAIDITPTGGNYADGIRLHARTSDSGWCAVTLCGKDNTGTTGTSQKTWFIGAYDGNFYIARNSTGMESTSTVNLKCVNDTWYINNNSIGTAAYKAEGYFAGSGHTHDYSNTYAAKNHTHDYSNTYAAKSHTHSYLPLTGGTLTGDLLINPTSDRSRIYLVTQINDACDLWMGSNGQNAWSITCRNTGESQELHFYSNETYGGSGHVISFQKNGKISTVNTVHSDLHMSIGLNTTTYGSDRAELDIISTQNTPSEFWLGSNSARYWATCCRNSSENYIYAVYTANGGFYAIQVDHSGNFTAHGGVTALSDIRHKTIVKNTDITVEQIANMPSVIYKWNDRKDDSLHVGSIAQEWQSVLPEAVSIENNDEKTLSFNYGVAALVSSITTARDVVSIKEKIKSLEDEIAKLKEKL